MRKRMEDVGGEFVLEPGEERGTRVRLTAPLRKL
jgi:signal transduction histidine kinase